MEPRPLGAFSAGMEPIDRRVTAVKLLALRDEPNATHAIGEALQIEQMAPQLAAATTSEIASFVTTGDATAASQLIHTAAVRRRRNEKSRGRMP